VGAIDEGLGQIDLAAVAQILGKRFDDLPEHARLDPFLHPTVNRLVRRVLARQCFPRRSGPQDPKHSIENTTSFDTRTPFAVLAYSGLRYQTLNNTPLLVSGYASP
jgi:hypothetical protein